ncbi:MAG: hypothetical protein LBJ15_02520 [Comamonas sp.]|jgi:hypothetical protein|uniref:hypothetical protein n=1 Tax=Comamonas sp. TaxID=34028 RepID=UPI0028190D0D|nr:hypothetical protein [Comamonas sp.]MDR0212862.1 hypothetical protein [Comamonas sp.]
MSEAISTIITKQRVKDWGACESGYRWFLENYKPEPSSEFVPLYQHLVRDKRGDDADWLMGKLFEEISGTDQRVKLVTQIAGADAKLIAEQHAAGAPNVTEDDEANAATTGYRSAAATTGYRSAAATTGYRSAAATTGYRSAAATTGDSSAAATTGNYSAAATTGYRSAAATTGYRSAAATTGDSSIAAALGIQSKAKASSGGAIVLAYFDGDHKLKHVRAAMVGQDGIKPDTWYSLDESGSFVESEED